jgi:prepilin-type processing-associated H-X9-DG protein
LAVRLRQTCGLNINAAFVDGHAAAITQDYAMIRGIM